jgi:hypothetical protein
VLLLAEGRAAEAATQLQRAAERHVCPICSLPDLARAFAASGQRDSAIAVYQRYLSTPWLWRYEPDAIELGWAMKRLVELYEEKGDTKNANAVRAKLIGLWRSADPELQAVVAQLTPATPD